MKESSMNYGFLNSSTFVDFTYGAPEKPISNTVKLEVQDTDLRTKIVRHLPKFHRANNSFTISWLLSTNLPCLRG
jgi:hypothetical protein